MTTHSSVSSREFGQKIFHLSEISLYLVKYTSTNSERSRQNKEKECLYNSVSKATALKSCDRLHQTVSHVNRVTDWFCDIAWNCCDGATSCITALICTFIESLSKMLLLCVTFVHIISVHKGKHPAPACEEDGPFSLVFSVCLSWTK